MSLQWDLKCAAWTVKEKYSSLWSFTWPAYWYRIWERVYTHWILYRLFWQVTAFIMNNTHPKWLHFYVHSLFYTLEHVRLVHLLKSDGFSLRLNEIEKEGGDRIKTGKQRSSLYLGPDFHLIFQVLIHFWFLFRQCREKPTISTICLHSSNLCHTVKLKKNSLLKENEPKFLDCEVRWAEVTQGIDIRWICQWANPF